MKQKIFYAVTSYTSEDGFAIETRFYNTRRQANNSLVKGKWLGWIPKCAKVSSFTKAEVKGYYRSIELDEAIENEYGING